MKGYARYKPTEISWIDIVPDHWTFLRAKNMFEKHNRPVRPEDETVTCFRDGKVTLRKNRRLTGFTESSKEIGYQGIRKGDLVIHVMDAFAGAIGVSDSDGKSTPVYNACTPKGNYNNYFYAYLLREMARTGYIQSLYRGIRERSSDFRFNVFGVQFLPIPPREEQDQIVGFLDWKVSEVNHFIRSKRREIARLNELANTRIKDAVLYGLSHETRTRDSQIEWIGNIPAHWDVRMLFQEATEQSISNKTVYNQNLLSLSYGKIVCKDINTTNGLLPASFDTYQIVNDGNIILRLTDLQNDKKSLRVGLVTQTGIITSAYTCLKPRSHVLPEYLYLLLHSYDVCKVFYGMGGGVRQSISYIDIRRMLLPLPGKDEQWTIVNYCYQLREQTEQMIAALKHEIELVIEYRTRIVSDVVTGKVDVRDIEIPTFEVDAEEAISDDELDEEAELEESDKTEGDENADD